jgi:hypothetical protein
MALLEARSGLRAYRKISGLPLKFGDLAPIVAVGSGYVEYRYKELSGKKLTKDIIDKASKGEVDSNFKRAVENWRFASMITQQSVRGSNRSAISKWGSFGGVTTLFQSGPLSAHRMVSSYVRAFNKAQRMGDKEGMRKAAYGVFVGHAVAGALYGAIDAMLTPDDERKLGKSLLVGVALGNLPGIFFWGRVLKGVADFALDKPWAKDVQTQLIPGMRAVDNIQQSMFELYELSSAPVRDEKKIMEALKKTSVSASLLLGVPVDGILRNSRGAGAAVKEVSNAKEGGSDNVVSDAWNAMMEAAYPSSVFDTGEEAPLGGFKNFTDAKDKARLYMAFQTGGTTQALDVFREVDKMNRIEVDWNGLLDFIQLSKWSPDIDPGQVIFSALAEVERERMKVLYGKGKDLNTLSEINKLLKEVPMTDKDRETFEKMRDAWVEYNSADAKADARDRLDLFYDKIYDITEKAVVIKK